MAPQVLQLHDFKVNGRPKPGGCNQIVSLAKARAAIAANHTSALALGYTSTLDPDHNFVEYTASGDPPSVTVRQYFVGAGTRFRNESLPSTGQWVPPQEFTSRPDPQMKTIAPPFVGLGCLIAAIAGQSNSNGSGRGRFMAQSPINLGSGGWAWNNGLSAFQCLADPIAGGNDGQGYDGGAWCRFCAQALGRVLPNGVGCNRVVIFSGSLGGTLIETWASPDFYKTTSGTSLALTVGTKVFTVPAGLTHIFFPGRVLRASSLTNEPFGGYMDGTVTSYSGTTLTMSIFAVGPQVPAGQTFNDWIIKPIGAGNGFNYFRDAVVNMANHGVPPQIIPFIHGESASGSPSSWANANLQATSWIAGFADFASGIGDSMFIAAGFRPIFYAARTTICNLHVSSSSPEQIDALASRGPDSYVANAMGQEAVRNVQWSLTNTVVSPGLPIRKGPDLDWIGPEHRPDGCHIGDNGLDIHANRWREIIFGS